MVKALFVDLNQRIMNTCNSEMNFRVTAKQFSVFKSTVQSILEKYQAAKIVATILGGVVSPNSLYNWKKYSMNARALDLCWKIFVYELSNNGANWSCHILNRVLNEHVHSSAQWTRLQLSPKKKTPLFKSQHHKARLEFLPACLEKDSDFWNFMGWWD